MMRGVSRWDEPRTPVVASAPAARTATVAAPSNGVRMRWTPEVGGRPSLRRTPPGGCKSPCSQPLLASGLQLHVAEQRERRFDDLRLVRERALLERLRVGHRQVRPRYPGHGRVEPVERLLLDQ